MHCTLWLLWPLFHQAQMNKPHMYTHARPCSTLVHHTLSYHICPYLEGSLRKWVTRSAAACLPVASVMSCGDTRLFWYCQVSQHTCTTCNKIQRAADHSWTQAKLQNVVLMSASWQTARLASTFLRRNRCKLMSQHMLCLECCCKLTSRAVMQQVDQQVHSITT